MDFRELLAARYSVRQFKNQPVERDKLDLILEAARNAPTAGNKQPVRVLVINDQAGLAKVDACTSCRFAAPLALLICYDTSQDWVRRFDGAHSGETDAGIVTTLMMLQAVDTGLGTCWVMHFDPVKTREEFALPPNLIPAAFLPMGYPADDAKPADFHHSRQPLEKMAFYQSFS